MTGIGEPEALKGNLHGEYSRRINEKDRLVYHIEDKRLYIVSCKGHYDRTSPGADQTQSRELFLFVCFAVYFYLYYFILTENESIIVYKPYKAVIIFMCT